MSGNSPAAMRAGAALILAVHISGGLVGILSGMAALAFRKGSVLHRRAGNLFFISMLAMAGIGAVVAPFMDRLSSTVAGALTFYLVATSWITVRRREGSAGRFEMIACLVAVGIAAGATALGFQAAATPSGLLDGMPRQPIYVFAMLAGIGAAGDLKIIIGRGISGAQRLARHLWRMCTALLIAAFSLFLGQPGVFPPALRGSFLMFIPEIVVLGSLIYWMCRVLLSDKGEPKSRLPGAAGIVPAEIRLPRHTGHLAGEV